MTKQKKEMEVGNKKKQVLRSVNHVLERKSPLKMTGRQGDVNSLVVDPVM